MLLRFFKIPIFFIPCVFVNTWKSRTWLNFLFFVSLVRFEFSLTELWVAIKVM